MNLKKLSEILALSQTTVSRALNGFPEVSEATRKKVESAARLHNYTPNTRARSLATGNSHAVGHVIPLSVDHEIVNPVFTDFIAGASEIYSRENFDMILSVVPQNDEEAAYRKFASKGSVDGVIVHGPHENDPRIKLLQDIGMPFVVHGRSGSTEEENYTWVDMNNTHAFHKATHFLLDLGHHRIGLLNGPLGMDFGTKRLAGYCQALEDHGLKFDPHLCRNHEMTEDYGFESAVEILAMEHPPTAFLTSSIITGIGVRRALDTLNLKIGKDVSLIVHDDELSYLRNGDSEPIYTATRSSVRQAGRLCAELLMQQIANPDRPPHHEILDAELVIGATTGPAPQG